MTRLDKLRELSPEIAADEEGVIFFTCPSDFGLDESDAPCKDAPAPGERYCRLCWTRELPQTEAGTDGV